MPKPTISNYRVIVSGKTVEVYVFSKPVGYNLVSDKRTRIYNGKSENPVIHPSAISRTRNNVIRIVNANAHNNNDLAGQKATPQFFTFTFKDNLTDVDLANKHFTNFIKRFNYHTHPSFTQKIKYLTVIEFQKRGAVHYHTVFFNLPAFYARSERKTRHIENLWSHGFVDVMQTYNYNYGFYLAKYMTKNTLDQRLVGKRRYFCSKGLNRPTIFHHHHIAHDIVDCLANNQDAAFVSTYRSNVTGQTTYLVYELSDEQLQEYFAGFNLSS